MKNLYIIGNGFDIHHCINSSYSAYRKWLLENDKSLHERLCEYFDINEINKYEWWNDFENNLGNIKLHDYIMLKSFINQPNYERDDFMNMDLYTDTSDIEHDIGGLVEEIKNSFSEWIQSLDKAKISNKIRISTEDNFFINFNYTHTLEDIYNIPSKDILHIHGDIDDKEIVFS